MSTIQSRPLSGNVHRTDSEGRIDTARPNARRTGRGGGGSSRLINHECVCPLCCRKTKSVPPLFVLLRIRIDPTRTFRPLSYDTANSECSRPSRRLTAWSCSDGRQHKFSTSYNMSIRAGKRVPWLRHTHWVSCRVTCTSGLRAIAIGGMMAIVGDLRHRQWRLFCGACSCD
jgi:hypothetical protein